MPGIRVALKQLASLGLPIIVISNQAAVGKGLLDSACLEEITTRMHHTLLADGTFVAAAYYCIHSPGENCPCRKPRPGLLTQAAEDFQIDLRRSVFIGDADTDVQAGWAAGCKPVLFGARRPEGFGPVESTASLSVARTAGELFRVTANCLEH
jgi:D-glycero-D-manno-heptose 1,7-bisphosphate phosphatase